jgi:hypothetical protein
VHLKFLKDTNDKFVDEIKVFLERYDELGAKLNKYIQYVDKEWK